MVPSVAELTTRAKAFENAGDPLAALTIYTDLLARFEADPETVPGGPDLYAQVGDLRLQLGQPARAFAAYQQAAELYAKRDSAEDVKKLCIRMINVVPAAGNVYARYARRLHELDHLDSALTLLGEYAAKAELEEVAEAVRTARGRPDSEKSSAVRNLLNTIDRDKEGHAAAARRVSRELGNDRAAPVQIARPKAPPAPKALAPQERAVRPSAPTARAKRPPRWLYVGSAAVGVAGMVAIIVALREPAVSSPGITSPSAAVIIDSTPPEEPVAASSRNASPNRPDSTVAAPSAGSTPQPPPTSVAQAAEAPATPPQAAVTAASAARPIVVESLLIRSVAPVEFRGQQGFRVVHQLDSVGEFIVESYPVDSNTARAYPLGTVIINAVPPDTTVSIVRFDEGHVVFASGVVSEERMRVLLGLLHIQPQ